MSLPLRLLVALAACALAASAGAQAPEASAPLAADTLRDLVARARAHQEETNRLLQKYSWVQHAKVEVGKPNGEIVERSERKMRVFPIQDGLVVDLLEVDGRAPTKKELAAVEKQNQRTQERARKLEARRAREGEDEEPDDDASGALLELLSRTRFEVAGRVHEGGRELVGIAFEPDPEAAGEGVERKLLRHSRGTVWLDAETAQPVRGEAGAADKFRVKGLVGVKDFSLVAEQVRVGDEIWLPSRFVFEGDISVLGIKRRVKTDVRFSEYSRATVETEAEVGEAPAPASTP